MSLRDWPILRRLSPDFFATIQTAFVFGDNALLIMSADKIFGVGTNYSGCLGVGDSTARSQPTEIVSLANKGIEGIACGGTASNSSYFVVAYSRTGDIYQWGCLPRRINSSSSNTVIPQKIHTHLNSKIVTVACGNSHCVILSADGKVFSFGSNNVGQLGHSENQTYDQYYGIYGSNTPCQVKGIIEGKKVIAISCGGQFSVVLLDDSRVITWGSNDCGQLGIVTAGTHSLVPVEVSSLNGLKIKKIACGSAHVLALSEANVLYGWGSNSFSQLGFSNPAKATVTYYQVSDLKKYFWQLRIIDIGASYACDLSVAQCESKEVYMFGKISTGGIISKPTDSRCESIDQAFAYYASPNMMRKPMRHILEAKRRTTILDTLENEFGNIETSDLTIVVGKNEIHVHQTILKMRSEYFKTMLSRWVKKDEKVVTIKKKSFAVINTYIKYLYTDKLEVDLNLALESFLLADEYGDDNFKSLCERSIKRDIKPEKVAEIFALTRKIKSCEDLNRFCLDFILNHAAEVIGRGTAGFRKWDVETMTAVFMDYVKKKENV